MVKPNQRTLMRVGLWVFLGLMVLEIVEFATGLFVERNWPFLALLAAPGAGLIVYYFMHIPQVWHREE